MVHTHKMNYWSHTHHPPTMKSCCLWQHGGPWRFYAKSKKADRFCLHLHVDSENKTKHWDSQSEKYKILLKKNKLKWTERLNHIKWVKGIRRYKFLVIKLVIKHRKYPQNTVLTLYGDRWQWLIVVIISQCIQMSNH